ncbi:hypothetical protein GCM10010394_68040 [Streptomyces crystallinus]|uniref:Integral membrane protein n=1 Tax=Streptomyces crystallinus TaxID=68191 RepID=A0ABN1H3J4_9ACTN
MLSLIAWALSKGVLGGMLGGGNVRAAAHVAVWTIALSIRPVVADPPPVARAGPRAAPGRGTVVSGMRQN